MKITAKSGVAATAATLFLAGVVTAPVAEARPRHAVKGHCMGVNACKGQSACKGAHSACKGLNACKGQGFLSKTRAACKREGGRFSRA